MISIEGLTFDEFRQLVQPPPDARRQQKGQSALPTILMALTAWRQMVAVLTAREPEAGGVLIGPKGHRSVTHFIPDDTGRGSPAAFTFDHVRLNEILRQYVSLGLDAKGFAHSHPSGIRRLSQGDIVYVRKAFLNPKNDVAEVLMPIVTDGQVYPYIVRRADPDSPLTARIVRF